MEELTENERKNIQHHYEDGLAAAQKYWHETLEQETKPDLKLVAWFALGWSECAQKYEKE